MMTGHVIHLNHEIDAAPEVVWEVLTDLGHADHILRSVRSVETLTEGRYGVGTLWREDRTMFGHRGTEELRVIEAEPPRHTIQETTLGHDTIRTAYSLQPHGGSMTKLLLTANLDTRDRSKAENMMWHVWGEISFESTRRMLKHDLEDIAVEAVRRTGSIRSAS